MGVGDLAISFKRRGEEILYSVSVIIWWGSFKKEELFPYESAPPPPLTPHPPLFTIGPSPVPAPPYGPRECPFQFHYLLQSFTDVFTESQGITKLGDRIMCGRLLVGED
ncbi:hypothetical protein BaRGS_00001945 [Batillaria attramentaria]|uniref:Uncharacterized protein n=1 Tax=Batillaria attramentaria TaxID=370345 RepID=A0ABD0M580_9CAEN